MVILCIVCLSQSARQTLIYALPANKSGYIFADDGATLKAVVRDDYVYLKDVHDYYLGLNGMETALPEGVFYLSAVTYDQNRLIGERVAKELYDALEVEPHTRKDRIQECVELARKSKLQGINFVSLEDLRSVEHPFRETEIINWLCGKLDLREDAINTFKEHEHGIRKLKRRNITIRSFLDNPRLTEPYEEEIARGLRQVDKNSNLTVLFGKDGTETEAKIKASSVWETLINREAFRHFHFPEKGLYQIMCELGCNDSAEHIVEDLTCKDIMQITYRNKVLYQKTDTEPVC